MIVYCSGFFCNFPGFDRGVSIETQAISSSLFFHFFAESLPPEVARYLPRIRKRDSTIRFASFVARKKYGVENWL